MAPKETLKVPAAGHACWGTDLAARAPSGVLTTQTQGQRRRVTSRWPSSVAMVRLLRDGEERGSDSYEGLCVSGGNVSN